MLIFLNPEQIFQKLSMILDLHNSVVIGRDQLQINKIKTELYKELEDEANQKK